MSSFWKCENCGGSLSAKGTVISCGCTVVHLKIDPDLGEVVAFGTLDAGGAFPGMSMPALKNGEMLTVDSDGAWKIFQAPTPPPDVSSYKRASVYVDDGQGWRIPEEK